MNAIQYFDWGARMYSDTNKFFIPSNIGHYWNRGDKYVFYSCVSHLDRFHRGRDFFINNEGNWSTGINIFAWIDFERPNRIPEYPYFDYRLTPDTVVTRIEDPKNMIVTIYPPVPEEDNPYHRIRFKNEIITRLRNKEPFEFIFYFSRQGMLGRSKVEFKYV
nr:hypothetical protein [uncultured Capnocytophaga sp.]